MSWFLKKLAANVLRDYANGKGSVLVSELPNDEYGMIASPSRHDDASQMWTGKREGVNVRFTREGHEDIVVSWPYTMQTARAELVREGLVLSVIEGEFRVNKRGGREATAYYTQDLNDAVATGHRDGSKGSLVNDHVHRICRHAAGIA